jgi:hypothetical protein
MSKIHLYVLVVRRIDAKDKSGRIDLNRFEFQVLLVRSRRLKSVALVRRYYYLHALVQFETWPYSDRAV